MESKKENICPVCKKRFKAMTDKQWKHAKMVHDLTTIRHEKAY